MVTKPVSTIGKRVVDWITAPVPYGRIAAFRTLVHLYVVADILFFTAWVREHAGVSGELYRPLYIADILHLPTPNRALVLTLFWALLVLAPLAATGRAPRILGSAVFVVYFAWMIIAMSYGKVDHDRVAFMIALAVLPWVGRAKHGDPTRSEAGGWALRLTQLGVIATYFLAAFAKMRYGGIQWFTSSTVTRSVLRRGTVLSIWMLKVPGLLVAAQFGIIAFEFLSPLIFFVRDRLRYLGIAGFYLFHAVVFATVTIAFVPHLVAMTCFLPLEKVRPVVWLRHLRDRRVERRRTRTVSV